MYDNNKCVTIINLYMWAIKIINIVKKVGS
jgi:hypothetical protein